MPPPPAPLSAAQRRAFRTLAEATPGIDRAVYEAAGRDWREPVIGLGRADAPLCFMGRDPGAEEAKQGEPFIGAGGKKVRTALFRQLHPQAAHTPTPEELRAVGGEVFWLNTVPYKPVGNKAWSPAVKQRFHGPMLGLLLAHWQGRHIVTLGKEALLWFGIGQPAATQAALLAFWAREDCFTSQLDVSMAAEGGTARSFTLHPLPHPSPANATWAGRFAGLLEAHLRTLLPPGR